MPDDERRLDPLSAGNCALLLIDHQVGAGRCRPDDARLARFRAKVLTLASTGRAHGLPTVLTASCAEGSNGPLLPELHALHPSAPYIPRPAWINAWEDPVFRAAVAATGRRKLIMAGATTDVCLYFPVASALADGYAVYAVYDASGCCDLMSDLTSYFWLQQAGAVVCDTAGIAAMLKQAENAVPPRAPRHVLDIRHPWRLGLVRDHPARSGSATPPITFA